MTTIFYSAQRIIGLDPDMELSILPQENSLFSINGFTISNLSVKNKHRMFNFLN